jgi:hypothetical protein
MRPHFPRLTKRYNGQSKETDVKSTNSDGNSRRGRFCGPTGPLRRVRVFFRDTSVCVSNQYGRLDARECTRRAAQIQDSNAG